MTMCFLIKDMIELNKNLKVEIEYIKKTSIFTIDNFYKHPKKIDNYLFNRNVPLWKIEEKPSYNNVYFEDRRFIKIDSRLYEAYNFLSKLCKQNYKEPWIKTNMTRFYENSWNDYKNCYWWPHTDSGYNGIVYFNNDCGTNLYEDLGWDENVNEHEEPWRPKAYYDLIKTIKPKYNRMVLFDGMIPHAMDICNNKFFAEEYRKNQAFFFVQ